MILIFIHIAIETSQYTVMNVLVESLNMETTCLCHNKTQVWLMCSKFGHTLFFDARTLIN